MSESKNTPSNQTYKAVYAGRRLAENYTDKKMRQVFIRTDNNKEMHFSGIKRVHLGYTYKCGATTILAKPERIFEADRIDNPEWEALDALVDKENAEKRAQAKIASNTRPAMKAAIEALRPLVRGVSVWEQKALIEFLIFKAREKK